MYVCTYTQMASKPEPGAPPPQKSWASPCHCRGSRAVHAMYSGVTRVLGARGKKLWNAPPIFFCGGLGRRTGLKLKWYAVGLQMPEQVGSQNSKSLLRCAARLLLSHLSNFATHTFVFVRHKIFWWGCFAPIACRATGATAHPTPPPPSYATYARTSRIVHYRRRARDDAVRTKSRSHRWTDLI